MKAFVTGANGFVGAALCRKLITRGDRVRGLIRKTSDLSLLEGVAVEKVVGSLGDIGSLMRAVEGMDVVYHVAAAVTDWGTEAYFREVNVEGTRRLLEAAVHAGVKRFVFVSSVVVHSFGGGRGMHENSPQLKTPFPYCRTKREAEALVMEAHKQGRIEVVIVRPGDVFGPGDHVSLLKMAPMLEKGCMALIGKGRIMGAFAYVENLVDGIVLAGVTEKASGRAYVLTDGIELTWIDYFQKLTAALGVPPPRFFVPVPVASIAASLLEGIYRLLHLQGRPLVTRYLVAHLRHDFQFSIDKARRELGYEPGVGIDEAIRRTASWYRKVVRGEETA